MEQMNREELINSCMKQMRESFDSEENMIAENYRHWVGGYHTRRTGVTHVIRSTAEYAAAVLLLKQKAEYERAFAALRKICDLQDKREGSDTYGLWPYYLEESLEEMLAPDYNCRILLEKSLLVSVCVVRRNFQRSCIKR